MSKRKSQTFHVGDLAGRDLKLKGRNAWALAELVKAGERGCTPIDNPGPRWSGYVHNLRRKHGLIIDTIHEAHGGAYSGTHARYVLRTPIRIAGDDGARWAA